MKRQFSNGTIQIARQYGGRDDDERCISIEVTDDTSHVQFVEIKLSLSEFAAAVFGRSGTPCLFQLRAVDKVGMIAENKEEEVPCGRFPAGDAKKVYADALKPFEVDGWHARSGDMGNGHRATENGYRVVFFRHVPATQPQQPAQEGRVG